MNYDQFVTAITNYTERDDAPDYIDTWITMAESRIYRDIDLKAARGYTTSVAGAPVDLVGGQRFFTLPTNTWIVREVEVVAGTTSTALIPKDTTFMREFWPARASTSSAVTYWARHNDLLGEVAPTPATQMSLDIAYTYKPDQLSSSNTSTWLSVNAVDLLLAGVMLQAMAFDKGEVTQVGNAPDAPGFWQIEYKKAVDRVSAEQMRNNGVDDYRQT